MGFVGTASYIARLFVATTAQEYLIGQCIGGLLTFTSTVRDGVFSAYLTDVHLIDKTDTKFQVLLVLFDSNPTLSTITDTQTVVVHPTDMGRVVRTISITPGEYSTVSGAAFADVELGRVLTVAGGGSDTFGVLILDQASVTFAGINDVILNLGYAID